MTRIEGQEGTITLAEGASSSILNLQGNVLKLVDTSLQNKLASVNVEQVSLTYGSGQKQWFRSADCRVSPPLYDESHVFGGEQRLHL